MTLARNSDLARQATVDMAEGREPTTRDFKALQLDLSSTSRRTALLAAEDTADVVADTIAKFYAACSIGKVRADSALAYARRIASNVTVDRLRRMCNDPDPTGEGLDDDDIAAFVSRHASAQAIEALLAEAAQQRQHTTTKVLGAFLHLCEVHGETPSNREVAREAEVSHPTVAAVLADVRDRLEQLYGDSAGDA